MDNTVALKKFCVDHNITVIDTNKRVPRHPKISLSFFENGMDYNQVHRSVAYETEPLLTVEIPQRELQNLADFESQVFSNMKQSGHYSLFHTLMEQKEEEKYLRERYPAVLKAYQQYSLMLKMAQSGEL